MINKLKAPSLFTSNNKLTFILACSSLVACIIVIFSRFSQFDFSALFNTDSLYLSFLYNDWLKDGLSPGRSVLSPSPHFFPDMPAYFIIHSITENVLITAFIWAFYQTFLLIGCFALITFQLISSRKTIVLSFSILAVVLIFLSKIITGEGIIYFFLFSVAFHLSALINTLICFFLFLKIRKKVDLDYKTILLLVIILLSVLSDMLFIVTFSIPFLIVLSIEYLKSKRKSSAILLLSFVFTNIAAYLIFRLLIIKKIFLIPSPHRIIDFDNISVSWGILVQQFKFYFLSWSIPTLLLIIVILCFVIAFIISFKSVFSKNSLDSTALFALFVSVFIPVVFFAPVLNGNYTGVDTIRYNISAIYFGVMAFPLLVSMYFPLKNITSLKSAGYGLIILSIFIIFKLTTQFSLDGLRKYFIYKPEYVVELEGANVYLNLQKGVGNYWKARGTDVFTNNNIKMIPVFDNLVPYQHLMNLDLIYGKNNRFNFIHSNDSIPIEVISGYFQSPLSQPEINYYKLKSGYLILLPDFYYEEITHRPVFYIK